MCLAVGILLLSGCGSTGFEAFGPASNETQVSKPVFVTPSDTGLVDNLGVEITCDTPGATIYYTLDGSDPNESSYRYGDSAPTTDPSESEEGGSVFNSFGEQIQISGEPEFEDPEAAEGEETEDGEGSATDESPTGGGVVISETTTIKARAYKGGLDPSEIAEATYSISGYPLGMLPMEPTQYSSIPLAMIPPMGQLPAAVDMRPDMPVAGNQGQQGSCVGWAVGYALKTYQENIEHGWGADTAETQFSPAYIYNQIKVGNCLSGSYIFSAFDLLTSQGCSTWALMPYSSQSCNTSPTAQAREEAGQYRIASWRRVNVQDTTELRAQLAGGFPIVIGMKVYTNFFYVRGTEIYDRTDGTWVGNHAICVVGYDDDTSTFTIINSWGTGWGDLGYCRISYDVFRQITFEAYVAQDIVEQTFTLDVTTAGEGEVTLDPPGGTYYQSQTVQLSAVAPEGWGFIRWEGDATGWTNPTALTMDSDKSVLAVFERDMFTLTINVEGGGSTDPPAGEYAYVSGEEVQLTATPDDNCQRWVFGQWLGDATGNASSISVILDEDKEITAKFTAANGSPVAFDQTVSASVADQVEFTLTGSDPEDEPLTFQIITGPASGQLDVADLPVVRYVSNDGFSGTDSFTFRASDGCTQSQDGTVELFVDAPILYVVTVNVEGEGAVAPFTGQQTFEQGTEVTLTATPAEGWQFSGWVGDLTGTGNSLAFTVNSDLSVQAVFVLPPVILNVSILPEGWGSVTLDPPGGSYTPGTYVTLTAGAGDGNSFVEWQGDHTGTDFLTSFTIEADMNVVAFFGEGPPSITLRDSRGRIPWIVRFDMRLRDASGRAIRDGVTRDDFLIYEDGSLLDYTETNQFVTDGPALPMKVMLVLDYTNSMNVASAIPDMLVAANQFVQAQTDAGEPVFTATHSIGVVEFHDRTDLGVGYDLVIPLTRADADGKSRIISAIPCESCLEHGLSRVWDSVDLAMSRIILADTQDGEARAVVFLSDGRDTTSVVTPASLIATAKAENIMLYPIGFGDVVVSEAQLQDFADQTGGMYYPADSATSLQSVFAEIAKDLNGQWNLTYITQRNSGEVEVKVEFNWQGGTSFTHTIDAGELAGDPYVGYVTVLTRTYDAEADTTSFLLKAEYVPRNTTYFRFFFDHPGATFALQDEGGLTSGWTLQNPVAGDYEFTGPMLQFGAFGNLGLITVPGQVLKLKIPSSELHDHNGTVKAIVLEGTLWE